MGEQEKNIYGVFNDFLANSLTQTQQNNEFKTNNFEILLDRYVNNYIGDTKDEKGNALLKKLKDNESDTQKKEKISLTFENKVEEQFSKGNVFKSQVEVSDDAKKLFGHLMWLQYLPATKPVCKGSYGQEKCNQIKNITGLEAEYKCDGCAGYGMAAMRLDEDLTDLVLLFNELVLKSSQEKYDVETIKQYIIKWCLDLPEIENPNDEKKGIRSKAYSTNAKERVCPEELLPIHNMLLHLCYPENYAPIAVSGHKKKIVETFEGLIPLNNNKLKLSEANDIVDDANEYNKKLFVILQKLKKNNKENNKELSVKFLYENEYKSLWNVDSDKDYSDVNALKFKKAIILYGPPGTSKTYSAEGLAKKLIFLLEYKDKILDFLGKTDQIESQIHHLQLHPNYTYEDFIWGYQISGTQTVAKKGYFLRLLDQIAAKKEIINDENKNNSEKKELAANKKERTHILILDEINRVDLSRLFGELFSAIENRNKPVDLPVEVEGKSQISIPDNLYIIGTMNEIDFSLERVDFALRRRFSWFFYGYNEDRLKDILRYKLDNNSISKFDDTLQSKYVKRCSALNKMINNDTDLGPKYEIGHTFFAELVDIWNDMPQKGIKIAQDILWNISIGPMIEAYLGNFDEENKKKKMDPFKAAFLIDKD